MSRRETGARKITSSDPEAASLAAAKWESSGLTADHAKALRFAPLSAEETAALVGEKFKVRSIKIPYFDLHGKPTDFYRVRRLEDLPGFAGLVEKPQRYAQPRGTLNEIYFPPLLEVSWADIAEDPNVTIYITEGELKAACACSRGLATLGLGGVDVWRATKRGVELLPALAEINWKNRSAVIVYDSDAATNANVVRAQRKLAQELVTRGALPEIASLPAAKDGKKQGLDDFIVAHGEDELIRILSEAAPFPEAEALWALSEEVVYIKDPGMVIVKPTGQKLDPGRFVAHAYANRHYMAAKQIGKGKDAVTVFEKKPLARRWIEWEQRHEVRGLTYAPGKHQIHDDLWNVWPGWRVQPVKGDVSCWKWLLDFLFKGHPEIRHWFEQWCAYPLQHPGEKLYTSAVIWGRGQGTGKTAMFYALMAIYGNNAIEIKNKHLKKDFNAWQENKQFVYGDEIVGSDAGIKKLDAEYLKGLITQTKITINQKFVPEFTIPDVINYGFSSQKPDAFFLDDDDRRYMIHEVVGERADRKFYEDYDRWLNGNVRNSWNGPGPAHLFHHLLNVDLKGFNPNANAPFTQAKAQMISSGKSDVGLWVGGLNEDPSTLLAPLGPEAAKGCDLFTASQILHCYDPDRKGKVSVGGLARALTNAGFRQINEASAVRTAMGVQRLWALRNPERWRTANVKEMVDHFNKFFGHGTKKHGV